MTTTRAFRVDGETVTATITRMPTGGVKYVIAPCAAYPNGTVLITGEAA